MIFRRMRRVTPTGENGNANGKFRKEPMDGQGEGVPKLVKDRLRGRSEAMVIVGIRSLIGVNPVSGKRYPEGEVCELLVQFIQRDGRKAVEEAAINGFVETLKHTQHSDTVNLLIKGNLFAKNSKNLELFLKILSEPGIKAAVRECTAEMLARYSEEEFGSRLGETERVLLECMMELRESSALKDKIRELFGKGRKERPMIQVTEERMDERTVEINTLQDPGNVGGASGIGTHAKPTRGKRMEFLAPTQDIDIIGLHIYLLQKEAKEARQEGANNLHETAMRTKDISIVKRIVDALEGRGDEFSGLLKDVRAKLTAMKEDAKNRATVPPEPG